MNPLLSNNSPLNDFCSLYRQFSSSPNPYTAMQTMLGGNPQAQQAMQAMRMGQSPESVYRALASQRGMDADQFLNQIRMNLGNGLFR